MTLAHSHLRQSLHLNIDASPYSLQSISSASSSPSSSSARASIGTWNTSPGTGGMSVICSVLCMYDFQSSDADHLAFQKNEILDVVKQEDTGWWAAMRRGGDFIGWIPQAFVNSLSEEMAEKLWNVREELRVYEYDAEQLYNAAPTVRNNEWYDPSPDPSPVSSPALANGYSKAYPTSPGRRPYPPPSPITPMPQPPSHSSPAYNKPTPPTPDSQDWPPNGRERPESVSGVRTGRRQPIHLDDHALSRLSTLIESSTLRDSLASPESAIEAKKEKIAKLTGSEEAWWDTNTAKDILPPYLLPSYSHQLKLDADGLVRTGTLLALVEKLSSDPLTRDPIKVNQENTFRNTFLMTFRTFTTANQLFDVLVARYHMERPEHLTDAQAEEWREKMQLPTQRRTLTLFTMWLQDHRLLEEEPHIAQRLTDFLTQIVQPQPLALTAKLIIRSIEDLTFANPTAGASPTVPPRKRRKSKNHKNDLLRLDPADIAEQLALLEFKLYAKLTPQECISYAKTQTGKTVENLCTFCSTHDKLAAWVKTSILTNEALGKRADTVDFWIKVAEKCRNLNNFASMSAVINALSSTVISRLHLTWAHVGRKSILDMLIKFNDPTGGFSGYRALLNTAEGPCVPFIGMYLTDIVHISDQFSDHDGQISFLKRQRWYEVVQIMLRCQARPYNIAESDSTLNFIRGHLRTDSLKDQTWFWEKSQEVQQSELAHADIRKGLEAAGF
ncbi:ras guanine nucleotide exchange factor domain-containing protein [Mycena epipterygia]|nr:ras guanine nucleotide exchange factor domain-containing protein [Mycena epipterygia]